MWNPARGLQILLTKRCWNQEFYVDQPIGYSSQSNDNPSIRLETDIQSDVHQWCVEFYETRMSFSKKIFDVGFWYKDGFSSAVSVIKDDCPFLYRPMQLCWILHKGHEYCRRQNFGTSEFCIEHSIGYSRQSDNNKPTRPSTQTVLSGIHQLVSNAYISSDIRFRNRFRWVKSLLCCGCYWTTRADVVRTG